MENGGEGEEYTIFSDSRSALQALTKNTIQPPQVIEIQEMIHRIRTGNISVELCWVPGHVNISGNEKADSVAKNAATTAIADLMREIPPH